MGVPPMPHDPAYLLAEKKIKEARRLGRTELDLSNPFKRNPNRSLLATFDFLAYQLTELPESIVQLTQLQTLNLSSNQP